MPAAIPNPAPPGPATHPASGATVVVVDDDEHIRELASLYLTKEGFAVTCAVDGVTLFTHPGDPVYAPEAGAVRSVGEVPGLGLAVILDHGGGWLTLLGRLQEITVRVGARVPRGFVVGQAATMGLELQLSQGGTWLDPAPWIAGGERAPPTPPTAPPAPVR